MGKRVTKVAKTVIGEKTVVCGRSTKWWDEEIKGKIKQRREVYKRFRHNRDSKLWTEYCKLRKGSEAVSNREETRHVK